MKIVNLIEYLAFRSAMGTLGLLPPRLNERVLRGSGRLVGRKFRYRRSVVVAQLSRTYPALDEGSLEELADAVYDHLGRTAAEIFCGDSEALLRTVRVEPGWQILDRAMSRGRGVIAATAHLGNFELGGRVLARRYPLLDVVKTQRNPYFDRYLDGMRRSHAIETVPMDRAARPVLRHLRERGVVSLLMDQDAGSSGLRIRFMGRTASTWPGPAKFSLHTGCPVVPMGLIRRPDGSHVLRLGPALFPEPYSDRSETVRPYLQAISNGVEAIIGEAPEQWFWVHRRWKGADRAPGNTVEAIDDHPRRKPR